ncbi:MAG: NADAR family protein [Muribaculaceae bacterium]|nr:NADAR family protein [Muribaculaceae bacterium]
MKYDIEIMKAIARMNPAVTVIYFWGHTPNPAKMTSACFSQWYDCYFEVAGVRYHTAEQYMMASKARLFGDEEVLQEIMAASTPYDYKELGRKVRGFD